MKAFFCKLLLFASALFVCQAAIGRIDLQENAPEFMRLAGCLERKGAVIYMGDSTDDAVAASDRDRSSIGQMLAAAHAERGVCTVSHGAYHMGVYEAYAGYAARSGARPRALVMPVNLRSFSPEWDADPGYRFERERFAADARLPLAGYFFRPLAIFGAIARDAADRGEDAWALIRAAVPPTPESVGMDYAFKYMPRLEKDHRKLVSLRNLARAAGAAGIPVYVYVTPIDWQGGRSHVGPEFAARVRENARLACAVAESAGARCLDIATALESRYFSHGTYSDEHLTDQGRRFVAEQIGTLMAGGK